MNREYSSNTNRTECQICRLLKPESQFLILMNCKHKLCKPCLKRYVTNNRISSFKCPFEECDERLEEFERQSCLCSVSAKAELPAVANHFNLSTKNITNYPKNALLKFESTSTNQMNSILDERVTNNFNWEKQIVKSEEKACFKNSKELTPQLSEINPKVSDMLHKFENKNANNFRFIDNDSNMQHSRIEESSRRENFQEPGNKILKAKTDASLNQYDNASDKNLFKASKRNDPANDSSRIVTRSIQRLSSESEKTEYFYQDHKQNYQKPTQPNSKRSTDSISQRRGNVPDKPTTNECEYNHALDEGKNLENTRDSSTNVQEKQWDWESIFCLKQLIKKSFPRVVDFLFIDTESDLALNNHDTKCLICHQDIRLNEGIFIPNCSRSFCRACLTQPCGNCRKKCTDELILLYSNSSNITKNCAIILHVDIRSFLMDSKWFVKLQKEITNDIETKLENFQSADILKKTDESKVPPNPQKSEEQDESWSDAVIFRNIISSTCLNCKKIIQARKGVILKECVHTICDDCIISIIMMTLEHGVDVRCPLNLENGERCGTIIQEREIKRLLSTNQYEKYEKKCLEVAQGGCESSAHCFQPNCKGWVIIDGYKESFVCPVCLNENCLSCKAIHQGQTCNAFQIGLSKEFSIYNSRYSQKPQPVTSQRSHCQKCLQLGLDECSQCSSKGKYKTKKSNSTSYYSHF